MEVLYNNEKIELDDKKIEGRDEFDELRELEDTIELNLEDIKNLGDNNEQR